MRGTPIPCTPDLCAIYQANGLTNHAYKCIMHIDAIRIQDVWHIARTCRSMIMAENKVNEVAWHPFARINTEGDFS